MSADPIFVVVASDDLRPDHRKPGRRPNPIVFETDVTGATLERAQRQAERLEPSYGPCRVARLVFVDDEAAEASQVLHVGGPAAAASATSNDEETTR